MPEAKPDCNCDLVIFFSQLKGRCAQEILAKFFFYKTSYKIFCSKKKPPIMVTQCAKNVCFGKRFYCLYNEAQVQ